MSDIKTFEYVDSVLRQVRDKDEPFGGIQVIFIGDFFQLPPVKKDENTERKYCFESKLWNALDLYTILLTKNYRQNEGGLIYATRFKQSRIFWQTCKGCRNSNYRRRRKEILRS